ncbi:hypothetical protein LWI29_028102 [Acer saccharum]|uniref:Uncharacterized protein n=1 Tax=Acer saccharum TaxID=4024 RepID=A0AA39TA49_ACESA|nr:hypothetical protein LWI29_028102 [Acer saccharum]
MASPLETRRDGDDDLYKGCIGLKVYKKPLKLYDHIVNSNEYLSKKALVIDFGNEFNGFATLNLDLSIVPRASQLACLQRSELFPELISEAIRELMSCFVKLTCILSNMQVHYNSLSTIYMGYPYLSRKVMHFKAMKAKEKGRKIMFQRYIIDCYASELNRFGCFDDIPCSRINEADSSKRAMTNLGSAGKDVEDWIEEEHGSLNTEAAREIGLHFIKSI